MEPPDSAATVSYRLDEYSRRLHVVEERTEDVRVLRTEAGYLADRVKDLSMEVSSLRRAIIVAALSFGGSALLVAATIFEFVR